MGSALIACGSRGFHGASGTMPCKATWVRPWPLQQHLSPETLQYFESPLGPQTLRRAHRKGCCWAGPVPRLQNSDTESKAKSVGESTAGRGLSARPHVALHPAPPSSSSVHVLEMTLAFDSPNFKGFVQTPSRVQSSPLLLAPFTDREPAGQVGSLRTADGQSPARPRPPQPPLPCSRGQMQISEIRLGGDCNAPK